MEGCLGFLTNGSRTKLSYIFTIVAGLFFWIGHWLFISTAITYPDAMNHAVYYLPGAFGTISLLIVNVVTSEAIRSNSYGDLTCCSPLQAFFWLFIGFAMGFGTIISSTYILINDFVIGQADNVWPGIAIFLQTITIFCASMILKFCTGGRD